MKILKTKKFEEIDLPGKNVDNAIINFLKKNPEWVIATLDKKIQKSVKNSRLIIRGKKNLEILN